MFASMLLREASGWETLLLDFGKDALHNNIRGILPSALAPWKDIDLVPKSAVQESVMNVLQEVSLAL